MNDITALALLVSKAKASVFTMEYISQFEASDIDSDDVDLRFEVDGVETGTNVSIVDECGQAAQMITALVEALEKAQKLATQQGNIACALFDEVTAQRQRIAELESRTVTVKLPERYDVETYPLQSPKGEWYSRDDVLATLAAAGIQVIEGEGQ